MASEEDRYLSLAIPANAGWVAHQALVAQPLSSLPCGRGIMSPVEPLTELLRRRERECRLTPDRALGTLAEAEAFLRDRGLLTRTADCALPSLYEACHEDPYKPGSPGFATWPATRWPWFSELAERGYLITGVHRGKNLLVSGEVAKRECGVRGHGSWSMTSLTSGSPSRTRLDGAITTALSAGTRQANAGVNTAGALTPATVPSAARQAKTSHAVSALSRLTGTSRAGGSARTSWLPAVEAADISWSVTVQGLRHAHASSPGSRGDLAGAACLLA
jgi:hypothetical protein